MPSEHSLLAHLPWVNSIPVSLMIHSVLGFSFTHGTKQACVTISSPIVWIWLPRADLGSAYKLAPPSLGLPQTKRLSMRISWSILMLTSGSSLSMGNYIQYGRSHVCDIHKITGSWSNICHCRST